MIHLLEKSRNKTNTFCKKHLWYCKKRSWQERGILHWSNFLSCKRLLWYKNHKLQKSNSARDTSGIASLFNGIGSHFILKEKRWISAIKSLGPIQDIFCTKHLIISLRFQFLFWFEDCFSSFKTLKCKLELRKLDVLIKNWI